MTTLEVLESQAQNLATSRDDVRYIAQQSARAMVSLIEHLRASEITAAFVADAPDLVCGQCGQYDQRIVCHECADDMKLEERELANQWCADMHAAESLLALALSAGLAECERLRGGYAFEYARGCRAGAAACAPASAPPVVEVPAVTVEATPDGDGDYRVRIDDRSPPVAWSNNFGVADVMARNLRVVLAEALTPQVAAGGSWEALIPDEADHALSYLLALIGSLGNASWTSHLRHEFGDEMADEAIRWIGKHTSVTAFSVAKVSAPWAEIRTLSAPGAGGVKDEPIQHDMLYTTIASLRADLTKRDAEIGRLRAEVAELREKIAVDREAAVAEEREACAQIVSSYTSWPIARDVVNAIRQLRQARTAGGGGERGYGPIRGEEPHRFMVDGPAAPTESEACEKCGGEGWVKYAPTPYAPRRECPVCRGAGWKTSERRVEQPALRPGHAVTTSRRAEAPIEPGTISTPHTPPSPAGSDAVRVEVEQEPGTTCVLKVNGVGFWRFGDVAQAEGMAASLRMHLAPLLADARRAALLEAVEVVREERDTAEKRNSSTMYLGQALSRIHGLAAPKKAGVKRG